MLANVHTALPLKHSEGGEALGRRPPSPRPRRRLSAVLMPSFQFQRRRSAARLPAVMLASVVALLLSAGSVQAAEPLASHHYKPGLSITGPMTEVSLYTKYTYTVQVVSPKSYRRAVVNFFVPPSDCLIRRRIRLTAYQPWQGQYVIEFVTTNEMEQGIGVSVFGLTARHAAGHLLFGKAYAVTPLPGQMSHYPPPSGTPCPQGTPPAI